MTEARASNTATRHTNAGVPDCKRVGGHATMRRRTSLEILNRLQIVNPPQHVHTVNRKPLKLLQTDGAGRRLLKQAERRAPKAPRSSGGRLALLRTRRQQLLLRVGIQHRIRLNPRRHRDRRVLLFRSTPTQNYRREIQIRAVIPASPSTLAVASPRPIHTGTDT